MRAEEYLKSTGIGDIAFFGPEPEFFVFDDIKWHSDIRGSGYTINSEEAAWSSSADYEGGNMGHRPKVKSGYFQYRQLIHYTTCVVRCVTPWSKWV